MFNQHFMLMENNTSSQSAVDIILLQIAERVDEITEKGGYTSNDDRDWLIMKLTQVQVLTTPQTWECFECGATNTHNTDDFGFCATCLIAQ